MLDAENKDEKRRCKYPGCGSFLHQGHDSDFCYIHEKSVMAQEEKGSGNKNSDTTDNNEFLSVEQLVEILPYSERTIRDMLQDGRIQGTRLGPRGQWLVMKSEVKRFQSHGARFRDLEHMGETDIETFRKSDEIMAEKDIIHLLTCLNHDNSYYSDDYRKLLKFMHHFYYEGNSYINPELERLRGRLWKVLEDLVISMKVHFVEEEAHWPFRPATYRLAGYNDHNDVMTDQERSKDLRDLKDCISATRRAYSQYRRAVKKLLSL